jgi:hypothetical protein
MKNKKYHNVRKIPKSNRKITERGQMNAPETHIHHCSPSWLGMYSGTSITISLLYKYHRYRLRV